MYIYTQRTPALDQSLLPDDQARKTQVVEAILKQKTANNMKAEAIFAEHRERQKQAETSEDAMKAFVGQGNKILLRIVRITIGATVKWERDLRTNNDH